MPEQEAAITEQHPAKLQQFVERLEQHSQLGSSEIEAIYALPFKTRHIPANEDFVGLGEQVAHCCLIAEGFAARFGEDPEGVRQITSVHMPGDWADLHSLVVPRASWGLQALSAVTVYQIPHPALAEAERAHPALAEALWRQCVIDAAIFQEWVINVGSRQALARLAHLLCEWACRVYRKPRFETVEFPLPITQEQIGNMLGLTSVHVSRTVKVLRETDIAEFGRGQVRVKNWNRLTEVAGFDPIYLHFEESTIA